MMRRRFRRRKASWSYADSQQMGNSLAAGNISYVWLLPPARAQFLMGTRQVNSLLYSGSHLWLDFYWQNIGSSTNLCDVNFGIFKTIQLQDDTPDLTLMTQGQWTQPSTPATLTSWNEDDDDGTNPFCWSHFIKGLSPANSAVMTKTPDPGSTFANHAVNQGRVIDAGTVDDPRFVCRKHLVTQEWQPDVVVRSKRRLRKGEGIVMSMYSPAVGGTLEAICDVHLRTLAK